MYNTPLTTYKDVDHPQGHGKLSRVYCNVEFNILIPVDLVQNPFYLFTSHGTHHHPPPPPTKLPAVLTQEIVDLIWRTKDPNITVGKLFYTFSQLVPNTSAISLVLAWPFPRRVLSEAWEVFFWPSTRCSQQP